MQRPKDLLALAMICELLSDVFLQLEGDLAEWWAEFRAAPLPVRHGEALHQALRELVAASTQDKEIEYVRLFQHSRTEPAYLYESYYRVGSLADPTGRGKLAELLEIASVQPKDKLKVPPDHLGIELAFLALLLRGIATSGEAATAKDFLCRMGETLLAEHLLPFSICFNQKLKRLQPSTFYRAAAVVLSAALSVATAMLTDELAAAANGSENDL